MSRARPQPAEGPAAPTRRRVLQAVGITGIAAVAAGCASAVTATSSTGASAPASAPTPPAPTASGSASSGRPTNLGPTASVPEGGGTIYVEQKIVVTQPVPGVFKGFSAVCPHLGCLVSSVADGRIDCLCHGSEFSVVDGSRIAGPALTGLSYADVTVSGADLVLNT